jgi:chromosome segregation ATPase
MNFIERALQIKPSIARCYMRCHTKFGDDHEALRVFSLGELNILSAHDVTHEQIIAIMEKKKTSPEMTRKDVDEMLRTLQRQEEAIDDRDRQLENVQTLLEDSKIQLDVTERESRHLKEQLAVNERDLAEKDKNLNQMRELLTSRTSGYSAMEKDLADKSREVDNLTAELTAFQKAKPKVEVKEVIVERLPDSIADVNSAVSAALAELNELDAKKSRTAAELAALESKYGAENTEIEAAAAIKRSMEELTTAWANVAGKMATVQLAVQASKEPQTYKPALEALCGMLRKYLAEIEAALKH